LAQRHDEIPLAGGQWLRIRNAGYGRLVFQGGLNQRVEELAAFSQFPKQKIRPEFHRDELMVLFGQAHGCQRVFALPIKTSGLVAEPGGLGAAADRALTGQIQTQFDAARMEAPGPIDGFGGVEIVPLQTEAETSKIPEELAPTGSDRSPSSHLAFKAR
jgi:hypothetical protein